MLINIIFVFFGFYLLIKGADFLVDGASNIAKKFRIPSLIIGLTIVAIGTSMPELMVSLEAILNGYDDITIGNVVGSNIANLFLILGVCSIINPLKFASNTEKMENLITIFATASLAFFGNNDLKNIINRVEGIIFILCSLFFIIYNIYAASESKIFFINENDKNEKAVFKSIFFIILGIIALKIGGDSVVKYSSKIAILMGVSEKIISVTVVAFATSLPEFVTSVRASIKGETDMAIGNIIGSQIFNIFLIIGISAFVRPIYYATTYNNDLCFLLFGTICFAIFPFIGKKHYMTRINGVFFLLCYFIYIFFQITNKGLVSL